MTLPITYKVEVDWDMVDWAVNPNFNPPDDDISSDVSYIHILRGKEKEQGNAPAATLEIRLKAGLCWKYSPFNGASPLHDKLLPWRATRVRMYHDSILYKQFFGFISRYRIDPHPDRQSVYLYVTDGLDLLARQVISQDYDNRSAMSDGQAVKNVLDAAGWSSTRRNIDMDGGDILSYPEIGVY